MDEGEAQGEAVGVAGCEASASSRPVNPCNPYHMTPPVCVCMCGGGRSACLDVRGRRAPGGPKALAWGQGPGAWGQGHGVNGNV